MSYDGVKKALWASYAGNTKAGFYVWPTRASSSLANPWCGLACWENGSIDIQMWGEISKTILFATPNIREIAFAADDSTPYMWFRLKRNDGTQLLIEFRSDGIGYHHKNASGTDIWSKAVTWG